MRASDRHKLIEEVVNNEGAISFANLKKYLPHISDMTLRRDLEYLDKEGRIIRIYGGARSVLSSIGTENNYVSRSALHVENKVEIASKAIQLLRPNTAIFIDSGTTVTEFCKLIPQEHYLIYTSGITCVLELKRLEKAEIFLLGGRLNPQSISTNGMSAINSFCNIHFNTAFIGSTGYDRLHGFTCGNSDDAVLKAEAIRRADRSIILLDSTKIGLTSTYTFASAGDVDTVVTDSSLSEESRKALEESNAHII